MEYLAMNTIIQIENLFCLTYLGNTLFVALVLAALAKVFLGGT